MLKSAISIQNMRHQFSNTAVSFDGLTIEKWEVGIAERVFLHGYSGSGKTTLLNLLSGILVPDSGDIFVLEQKITGMSNSDRDDFRAKNIGVVFQQFNLIPYLSVLKNIELATYFAKNHHINVHNEAQQLLKKLQLPTAILSKKVSQLSVGQQQRVAIARALINRPRLLLVDEPTSSLDASARDAFMNLLMQICNTTKTALVFVSHDVGLSHYFDTHIDITALCQVSKVNVIL